MSREEIVKVVPGLGSKFFFDQNWDGTGLHFSDRDRNGTENVGAAQSRFKAFTKGIYQSDSIDVSKQKKAGKGTRSERIL